jgi:hypothetical protein
MTEFGKPFAVAGFGNGFREQCDMANCSPHQIAITGHASLKEIVRYTNTVTGRGSRVPRGETGTSIVKP